MRELIIIKSGNRIVHMEEVGTMNQVVLYQKLSSQASSKGASSQMEIVQEANFNTKLEENQVLIKVLYSPVEQLDVAVHTLQFSGGCALGTQGCGIIENVGSNLGASFMGRKVAFCMGAWSKYIVKDISRVIVFDNPSVDTTAIAHAIVNPMTALCLRDHINELLKSNKEKSLVMFLGAENSLGTIFQKISANSHLYQVLPVVSSSEYFQYLPVYQKDGMRLALDWNGWFPEQDFIQIIKYWNKQPVILIDCLANDATSKAIKMLPLGSKVIMIGNSLERRQFKLNSNDLFMNSKTIEGFNFLTYLQALPKEKVQEFQKLINEDFSKCPRGDVFADQRLKGFGHEPMIYSLGQINQAITELDKEGKDRDVLINCCL